MKLVKVVWVDITSSGGWHTDKQLQKFISSDQDGLCEQVGFLHSETEEFVILTDTIATVQGGTQYGNLTKIPLGVIVNIVALKEVKPDYTSDLQ